MKVALYARVSTRDKGQNPEMQLDTLRKYCLSVSWTITGEYIDFASADDFIRRKRWTDLMKDASLHKFDAILVWKLDRAFRSIIHANDTLTTLMHYSVGFRSYNDPGIDTTTPNGMLFFNILASFAQFEKDIIVMRVNEGIKFAQEHGTKSGKAFGRPAFSVPLQTICKAVYTASGSYSGAARILSQSENLKIDCAFVSIRLKRANITRNEILQTPGKFFDSAQIQRQVLNP
jgi:DNA invertase Pin-like site-specific DNA recombinase